ncbi:hypothetical protein ABEF86_04115 [Acinetobacter thermotolerans]|uniref:hypothetical protein n=1 Tax=Acinetobacter thermotolerans TaxID=3151487 RepID=UPI00325AD12B
MEDRELNHILLIYLTLNEKLKLCDNSVQVISYIANYFKDIVFKDDELKNSFYFLNFSEADSDELIQWQIIQKVYAQRNLNSVVKIMNVFINSQFGRINRENRDIGFELYPDKGPRLGDFKVEWEFYISSGIII